MRRSLFAVALLSPLIVGCQKGDGGVKVSGRILRDGQPLPKAQVVFQSVGSDGMPDPNKEAGGETDENGKYSLKRSQSKDDGVIPGDYRVEIHSLERSATGIRELVPSQYNKASTIKFTVPPGGTSEAHFDLKTK